MGKIVMVDCLSQFRIRYAVEVGDDDPPDYALDEVVMNEAEEFSQEHLGLTIVSHRVVDADEYIRMFDDDNDYLKSWDRDMKFKFIRKMEKDDAEGTG
jgi:hypothetical protein